MFSDGERSHDLLSIAIPVALAHLRKAPPAPPRRHNMNPMEVICGVTGFAFSLACLAFVRHVGSITTLARSVDKGIKDLKEKVEDTEKKIAATTESIHQIWVRRDYD